MDATHWPAQASSSPMALVLSQVSIQFGIPLPYDAGHRACGFQYGGGCCYTGGQLRSGVHAGESAGHASGHTLRHRLGQPPQSSHFLCLPPQHDLLLTLLGLQRTDLILMEHAEWEWILYTTSTRGRTHFQSLIVQTSCRRCSFLSCAISLFLFASITLLLCCSSFICFISAT